MISWQHVAVIFAAADFNAFVTAIGPVLAVLISGGFTYVGYVINNRAKSRDQMLVSQAQEYDGIKTGQQFMREALDEAKNQITSLRVENRELQDTLKKLEVINEELQSQNRRLELLSGEHERKIKRLESQLRNLKDEIEKP